MAIDLKKFAAQQVKPRVRPEVWALLRDPLGRRPVTPRPPSLNELAVRYKTDKWGLHRYTQHYDRHLRHLRDKPVNVLEIGIGGYAREKAGGASLRMWHEYFRTATIVGLDIEDKSFVDQPGIRTYQGSQVDHDVLQRILDDTGEVQVIIDDGSHRPEHIRETFAYLFPRLAPNGIYAIEDTQTSYWPTWGGSEQLGAPDTTMALVKDLIDGLNHEEFLDPTYRPTYVDLHVVSVHAYHNLVIIEKGNNVEGTNRDRAKRTVDGVEPAPPVAEQRRAFSVPVVES